VASRPLPRRTVLGAAGATLAAATVGASLLLPRGPLRAAPAGAPGAGGAPETAGGALALRTRPLPRTGEPLPVIGLGTWQTFDAGPAERGPLREVLARFLAAGARVVDSSPMYGRAEETVGALLGELHAEGAGAPARPFLATKVWTQGREAGVRQMEQSLQRMGGRLDLLQVHNLLDWQVHLDTLRAWKREGRIRHLGVTHYQRSAFDALERLVRTESLDFVQLPYSVSFRDAEARLLPAARDTGTAVLVMRPFEGGDLFASVRGKPLPPFAREWGAESWAQLFLKFLLGHPAVTCPIPATRKLRHLEDNLRAGVGPLPDAAQRRELLRVLGV
jgi:diketogulonate reductase-like aldo/keto reductase